MNICFCALCAAKLAKSFIRSKKYCPFFAMLSNLCTFAWKSMKNKIRNILFFVGLASVVIMLLTFDVSLDKLWADLTHAGYWLIAILALWVLLYAMNTLTWRLVLKGSGPCNISFLRLMKITVSGFALNNATPIGLLGGEPYKIMELSQYVGTQRATSSVMLFTMTHIFTHFCYWLTAIVLYLVLLPITPAMAIVLGLSTAFCDAGLYFFICGYKNGMVEKLIRFVAHIPGCKRWATRFSERHADEIANIDRQIAELQGQNKRTFYTALVLEYVGRIMQSLEIYFLLIIFNGGNGSIMVFVQSILILAFTSLFANILGFIPMQLGGREGGFALSTAQMGLTNAIGLFISIICRVRELFFTIIGILLMKVKEK